MMPYTFIARAIVPQELPLAPAYVVIEMNDSMGGDETVCFPGERYIFGATPELKNKQSTQREASQSIN